MSDHRDAIEIVDKFHRYYFTHQPPVTWMGVPTLKCPLDLWVYQQLIVKLRPDVIIETGTYLGGSALFMAHVLDMLHGPDPAPLGASGPVIYTIDTQLHEDRGIRPVHPRIRYIHASSLDPETIEAIRTNTGPGPKLVVLDSEHGKEHVLAELRAYAPMVTLGSYCIVEDTNIYGHPVHHPTYVPGPYEAVDAFLAEDSSFVRDRECEGFHLTFNPGGFLRRVA